MPNNVEHENQGTVSSTGEVGADLHRSEGRAYYNYPTIITDFDDLTTEFSQFRANAQTESRRRVVFRAIINEDVLQQLLSSDLPKELIIPLSQISSNDQNYVVILGENVHLSEIPEWGDVYQYWQHPNGSHKTPMDRVIHATKVEGFQLTNQLTLADSPQLARIWAPFGWSEFGVRKFIESYQNNPNVWFSGVRDPETNLLVSACEGERLQMAGIDIVEGTEYGTLPGYEGLGLCTAAVTNLHAQILNDTVYTTGETPLIVSEFNMTSRSDIVGRHAGMTIPLVENTPGLEDSPIQVLKYNVSVLDRETPNNLNWRALGEERHTYRDAFRNPFRYWRNFIVGILPEASISTHYSREQVQQILASIT